MRDDDCELSYYDDSATSSVACRTGVFSQGNDVTETCVENDDCGDDNDDDDDDDDDDDEDDIWSVDEEDHTQQSTKPPVRVDTTVGRSLQQGRKPTVVRDHTDKDISVTSVRSSSRECDAFFARKLSESTSLQYIDDWEKKYQILLQFGRYNGHFNVSKQEG